MGCWIVTLCFVAVILSQVDGGHKRKDKGVPITQESRAEPDCTVNKQKSTTKVDIPFQQWPAGADGFVQIPYELHASLSSAKGEAIHMTFQMFSWNTCIEFVRRDPFEHNDYVLFQNYEDIGCFSEIGKIGGMQKIEVQDSCSGTGDIAHSILHTLGMYHEHQRTDRDSFVIVYEDNIKAGAAPYFEIKPDFDQFGTNYDYLSVMQFSSSEFAKSDNVSTIKSINGDLIFAQRNGLSEIDIEQVNAMYNCNGNTRSPGNPTTCYYTTDRGLSYRGTQSYSWCLPWDTVYNVDEFYLNDLKENYCRNPYGQFIYDQPGCLYEEGGIIEFIPCDIPACDSITELCSEIVVQTGQSGMISTPNYPGLYPNEWSCTWHIMAPENTYVVLRFAKYYGIEVSNDECIWDILVIYDGGSLNSPKWPNFENHCDQYVPPNVAMSGNEVIVTFSSDSSVVDKGFIIHWVAEDACAADEIRCHNGTCLDDNARCDVIQDCPSGSDEIGCENANCGDCGNPAIPPEFKWHSRIVGGYEAVPHSWPWMARLLALTRDVDSGAVVKNFTCGATLIDHNWGMTAAHCVENNPNVVLLFGDHNADIEEEYEQERYVDQVFAHPMYNGRESSYSYDIALLFFQEDIQYSDWIQPVCLSTSLSMDPPPGVSAIITGWGLAHENYLFLPELQQGVVPLNTDADCDFYAAEILDNDDTVSDKQVCFKDIEVGGVGSCSGDSGGPAVVLTDQCWMQIGITSWGYICGGPESPAYYTRVSYFYDSFIEPHLNNTPPTTPYESCSSTVVQSGSNGTFQTPNYPNLYPANWECTWLITAPEDTYVVIRFDPVFGIEYFPPYCDWDYLEIYDGGDMSAPKWPNYETHCDYYAPPSFRASSNEVFVKFVSDDAIRDIGFKLMWEAEDECDPGFLQCHDGTCLDDSVECDGTQDCFSGSDEIGCTGTSCECGTSTIPPVFNYHARIIAGYEAVPNSWPWMGTLWYESESGLRFICGTTLISERWAMTAGHCVFDSTLYVIFGDHDRTTTEMTEQRREVCFSIVHPEWSSDEIIKGNDIALLFLKEEVEYNDYVQPVCLSTSRDMDADPMVGDDLPNGVIIGWGNIHEGPVFLEEEKPRVSAPTLQQGVIPIAADESCNNYTTEDISDKQICIGNFETGGISACFGDSGGPLHILIGQCWYQIGITSWGTKCGIPGTYNGYTRVSAFYQSFIEPHLNKTEEYITECESATCDGTKVQTGTSGVIQTPFYPNNYINNFACTWHIMAPANNYVVIKFNEDFGIEFGGSDCIWDYLKIYDGGDMSTAVLWPNYEVHCGVFNPPPSFRASSNEVFVKFSSDFSVTETGFQINWSTEEKCTGQNVECHDGTCLNEIYKCDGEHNCFSGADEIGCENADCDGCGNPFNTPLFKWHARIFGGYKAVEHSWPWVGYLELADYSTYPSPPQCSVTLIGERWVLTTVLCVRSIDAALMTVFFGDHDRSSVESYEQKLKVQQKFLHPDFSYDDLYANDIALLYLDGPVTYNEYVHPVCLPNSADMDPMPEVGDRLPTAVITGFGHASPYFLMLPTLQQAVVPIQPNEVCDEIAAKVYNESGREGSITVSDKQICAGDIEVGGIGPCFGDLGGPLVLLRGQCWTLIGLGSWVGGNCDEVEYPAYYTRVSNYYENFIKPRIIYKAAKLLDTVVITTTGHILALKRGQDLSNFSITLYNKGINERSMIKPLENELPVWRLTGLKNRPYGSMELETEDRCTQWSDWTRQCRRCQMNENGNYRTNRKRSRRCDGVTERQFVDCEPEELFGWSKWTEWSGCRGGWWHYDTTERVRYRFPNLGSCNVNKHGQCCEEIRWIKDSKPC